MTTRDEWDYENAEVHEGEREVMSVYCVRFAATEIADIRAAAKQESFLAGSWLRKRAGPEGPPSVPARRSGAGGAVRARR